MADDKQAVSFIDWFSANNGSQHAAIAITTFEGMGRGAVATSDIQVNTLLNGADGWDRAY